jgi:serine/threonine protein kinase/predicted Zn-dependent protease
MSVRCPKCHFENTSDSKFCKECGTQLPSLEDIEVTETIETPKKELTRGTTFAGRYEIIEELGKGGMGRVYRVEDKKLDQEVALKLIKPEIAKDKKTIERFRNELKLARNIRHKNVCGMYDLGETEGAHFITMEYVRGEDLRSSIRRFGQLPIGKSISIAKQICEGLSEAHRLGVVHRDLKSNNIMIDKEGNVRIMDFGIARSLEAKGITGAGVMIGTPEYMSPEQVEGKEVDQRSDIYSLGVILYEMATGRVPFEGDTPFTIGMKHKGEMPQNPKELNTQISDDLSRVILRCLEKYKEKRYQSAGEVRSELANIEKGIPTTERIVSERKPLTSREITVQFSLKKLFIPALIVIAVVVAGLVLWKILPKQKVAPLTSSGKPSLAVMYFKNNTGDENYDTWRSALSDSIITDLSQSKYMKVLSGDRLYSILRKLDLLEAESYASEDLLKVAAEGRVNHILQGGLSKAGDIFRIDYTLQDINTGEIIGSDRVEGRGEESIFSMVDDLTRGIKSNLNFTEMEITSDLDEDITQITTSSPEAFKLYVEGRKYHNSGEYRKSIQFMEKAVAIDPEFAIAYRSMGSAYSNLYYGVESRKYIKKAYELRERLSDRESYLIQGDFFRLSEKTYDKSIEAYNNLIQLYPEDITGNTNLAILYKNLEQWNKAIDRCEVMIQAQDKTFYPYIHLADALERKGLYERARKVLNDYLNNISDDAWIHWSLAENFLAQGEFDSALVEADKSLELFPNYGEAIWIKGYIYLCKDDLKNAQDEFQKLYESEEQSDVLSGWLDFALLLLTQGRFEESNEHLVKGIELAQRMGEKGWEASLHMRSAVTNTKLKNYKKALEEIDRLWELATEEERLGQQRSALYWRAYTYLEMGDMARATKTADELKEMIEQSSNRKLIRIHDHLQGVIELKKNNYPMAIEHLEKALSLVDFQETVNSEHAFFVEPIAYAYYKNADMGKAQENYERIISLTTGRTYWGDIYAESFYMLGKICEQQGDTDKAIEHYEKFLILWKNADPGIADVEDARKRLAGLQDQ